MNGDLLLALRNTGTLLLRGHLLGAALPLSLRVGASCGHVGRHAKLGHMLLTHILRREDHLILRIRMHQLLQLNSF